MNKNKLLVKINELLESDNYIYEIEDIDDMSPEDVKEFDNFLDIAWR